MPSTKRTQKGNPKRKPTKPTNPKKPTQNGEAKRRKKDFFNDAEIDSDELSGADNDNDNGKDNDDFFMDGSDGEREEEEVEEEEVETVDEKRHRLAMEVVKRVKRGEELERERGREFFESDGDEDGDDSDDEEEREGNRDSLAAKILQKENMEESGRLRRLIASKLMKPDLEEGPRMLVKHRQSVTALALSDDDARGFSASKDGCIAHWDVESGKTEKYLWPSEEVLKSHGMDFPKGRATKHSRQVLALATSSDGRYLASGGLDRHIHLWDTRTREHIQAFRGHKGPVSCLAFRQGTSELFSGSSDRMIRIWNVEDRAFITTVHGHQSEILSIDCLRKERVLTAGRDRTLQLHKIPEETHLIFRAPGSSLECCRFVSNDEFLSGSDDGSIELWSVLKKKPVSIVRNAHAVLPVRDLVESDNGRITSNGHIDGDGHKGVNLCSTAQSWVSSVAVCRNSDLAASGAGNGSVRLWAIENEARGLRPLFDVPLMGYVNSLLIAKSGQFLVAGVGQEPRLGRWGRIPTARNGVSIQSLKLSS